MNRRNKRPKKQQELAIIIANIWQGGSLFVFDRAIMIGTKWRAILLEKTCALGGSCAERIEEAEYILVPGEPNLPLLIAAFNKESQTLVTSRWIADMFQKRIWISPEGEKYAFTIPPNVVEFFLDNNPESDVDPEAESFAKCSDIRNLVEELRRLSQVRMSQNHKADYHRRSRKYEQAADTIVRSFLQEGDDAPVNINELLSVVGPILKIRIQEYLHNGSISNREFSSEDDENSSRN
jgi:hypothetical protein